MLNLRPKGSMEKQEQKYIERIINGETELFSLLVQKYSQQTFQLIIGIVRNRENAEELTQDCFLKFYRSLPKFKGECLLSTWIYRIAYNTAISATRKKKQEYLYIEEQTIDQVPDHEVDEQFEQEYNEERLEKLKEAMAILPPEERGMLQLFYTEQKTIEEMATVTGFTPSNVKVKMHRIRKKLYILLTNERYNLL